MSWMSAFPPFPSMHGAHPFSVHHHNSICLLYGIMMTPFCQIQSKRHPRQELVENCHHNSTATGRMHVCFPPPHSSPWVAPVPNEHWNSRTPKQHTPATRCLCLPPCTPCHGCLFPSPLHSKVTDAPRLSQMLPDAPRCSQMFPDDPRWSQMLPDVHRCSQMFADGPSCSQMLPDAPRCCQMLPDAPRCCQMLQMLPDAPRCSQMLPDAPRCCQMLPDAP
jgi:hypothetical protein